MKRPQPFPQAALGRAQISGGLDDCRFASLKLNSGSPPAIKKGKSKVSNLGDFFLQMSWRRIWEWALFILFPFSLKYRASFDGAHSDPVGIAFSRHVTVLHIPPRPEPEGDDNTVWN